MPHTQPGPHLTPPPPPHQALTHLIKFRERQQEPLSEITATPSSQLKFVEDAWKQVGGGGALS